MGNMIHLSTNDISITLTLFTEGQNHHHRHHGKVERVISVSRDSDLPSLVFLLSRRDSCNDDEHDDDDDGNGGDNLWGIIFFLKCKITHVRGFPCPKL